MVTHDFTKKSLNDKTTYLKRFFQTTIQKPIFLANFKKYLYGYSREFEENCTFNDLEKLGEVIFIDCYDDAFFTECYIFLSFQIFFMI